MRMLAASTAFCLIATTFSGAANADDLARFDSRKIAVTGLDFALSPSASKDRIHLNRSMIKTTAAPSPRKLNIPTRGGPSDAVLHLIASAEAGAKGYDAVQHGARVRPPKRPTGMTIGEIYRWVAATPGQPHAIGRYQFIPNTLKTLVTEAGLSKNDVFTPQVQDLLADILLEDAGFTLFMKGKISRHRFMENLARIWAGLPTSTGRSYYDGHAGNRAVITWNEFDSHMKSIFESNARGTS